MIIPDTKIAFYHKTPVLEVSGTNIPVRGKEDIHILLDCL